MVVTKVERNTHKNGILFVTHLNRISWYH